MKLSLIRCVLLSLMFLLITLVAAGCGETTSTSDGGLDVLQGDTVRFCVGQADCDPYGLTCVAGVCQENPGCTCNSHCKKSAGEVCDLNQTPHKCVLGSPPTTCASDCDCYTGETCNGGNCKMAGGDNDPVDECNDTKACTDAAKCCVKKKCVTNPTNCTDALDCCPRFKCEFSNCVPDNSCKENKDCNSLPNTPYCREVDPSKPCNLTSTQCACSAVQCGGDSECNPPLKCDKQQCKELSCTKETCPTGYWCNTQAKECQKGCDEPKDCVSPDTCNESTHACVDCCGGKCTPVTQTCDTTKNPCVCITKCTAGSCTGETPDCDTNSGTCKCNDKSCPAPKTCDKPTGLCKDTTATCNPPCDPATQKCSCIGAVCLCTPVGDEGSRCTVSGDCKSGLACDNNGDFLPCGGCDPNADYCMVCRKICTADTDCSPRSKDWVCQKRTYITGLFATKLCVQAAKCADYTKP